jgi:hypothetical protein
MKINFLGDIYLQRPVAITKGLNIDHAVLNLEAPFSCCGTPAKNKINLNMDQAVFFETFCDVKISAVNLANNHIMDFGDEAFAETIKILDQNNIKYFGAGTKKNNFNNPVIIDENTALFGYACRSVNGVYGNETETGAAPFEFESVLKDIGDYKGKYRIVLNIHWGKDYHSFPKPEDIEKAHKLIDAGAEVIIGHHPHITQSVEVYRGKYIFYSIGNCLFDDLNLRSFYNGSEFTKEYRSRWKKRNRISISVGFDTDSGKVSHRYLIYRGKILEPYSGAWKKFKNSIILNRTGFKLYQVYLKKKFNVEHFFENPRLPSIKKIFKFLGVKK